VRLSAMERNCWLPGGYLLSVGGELTFVLALSNGYP
jgi:hypothetical protein